MIDVKKELNLEELEKAIEGNEALYKEAGIDIEEYKAELKALEKAGKEHEVFEMRMCGRGA